MEHLVNVEWYGLGHRGIMAHAKAGFAFHIAFWRGRISAWVQHEKLVACCQHVDMGYHRLSITTTIRQRHSTRQRHDKAQQGQHISSKRAGM